QYLEIHDLEPGWDAVLHGNSITDAIVPAGSQEVSALRTLGWMVDCRDTASGSVVMSDLPGAVAAQRSSAAPTCA
ncbi:MAG TPA: hypothetical protein VLU92_00525, partial [Candidatus Dormibacteraeota bacterium]|nr:hypothetical protein [Candidatus Dormibacteraeota bacterium]